MEIRERFLSEASATLQDSAPSSARQLRINLKGTQELTGRDKPTVQAESCPACGDTRLESRTVKTIENIKQNIQRLSRTTGSSQSSELVISKCQTCLRSTKTLQDAPLKTPSQEQGIRSSKTSVNRSNNPQADGAKVQKTSSKKRAKERKSRQGLQTLLGKGNDKTESSHTFNLLDFMSSRT